MRESGYVAIFERLFRPIYRNIKQYYLDSESAAPAPPV